MSTITLRHPSGPILLAEVRAQVVDDRAELTGLITTEDWERIEVLDIFGAASRTRSPGGLPRGDFVRITIATDAEDAIAASEASGGAPETEADLFVILDAMRSIDVADLLPPGVEVDENAEVWEGLVFSDPGPWQAAISALAEEGFALFEGLASATTVHRESDGLSVEFRHFDTHRVSRVQVVSALPMGDAVTPGTFEFLNSLNASVPFGTAVVDAGDLIVRETVPDELGAAGAGLIAARAETLVAFMGEILEPTLAVASGAATPAEALAELFGQ